MSSARLLADVVSRPGRVRASSDDDRRLVGIAAVGVARADFGARFHEDKVVRVVLGDCVAGGDIVGAAGLDLLGNDNATASPWIAFHVAEKHVGARRRVGTKVNVGIVARCKGEGEGKRRGDPGKQGAHGGAVLARWCWGGKGLEVRHE